RVLNGGGALLRRDHDFLENIAARGPGVDRAPGLIRRRGAGRGGRPHRQNPRGPGYRIHFSIPPHRPRPRRERLYCPCRALDNSKRHKHHLRSPGAGLDRVIGIRCGNRHKVSGKVPARMQAKNTAEPHCGTPGRGDASQQRLEALGYKQELSRTMSLYDVIVYGLIYMVPLAPLQVFGFTYNFSAGMVAAVYAAAAVAMYFSAVSYSEMALEF